MMHNDTVGQIDAELDRARAKFPAWPYDPIHQAAIVAEEAGELVRACLRMVYEGGSAGKVRTEALHVAATAARFLEGK